MSNPHPYQFYASGGWQTFSETATPIIDAAIGTEQVWEAHPPADKKKSERRIRRPRTQTPDGAPLDWTDTKSVFQHPGTHIWDFFHTKASFFKKMRAL